VLKISDICMIALARVSFLHTPAVAQDAMSAPAQKTIGATKSKMVPSLAVLNSGGAKLEDAACPWCGSFHGRNESQIS
jgi:hypothetical protein